MVYIFDLRWVGYVKISDAIAEVLTMIRMHWSCMGSSALTDQEGPPQRQHQSEYCSGGVLDQGAQGSSQLSDARDCE